MIEFVVVRKVILVPSYSPEMWWGWWGLLAALGILVVLLLALVIHLRGRMNAVKRQLRVSERPLIPDEPGEPETEIAAEIERQVKERTAELAAARWHLESVNSIFLRWDAEGRVLSMNEFGQQMFGYTEDELRGKSVIGTIVPDYETSGTDLRAMIHDLLRRPDQFAVNENENLCKDGSRIWIAWRNNPMFNPDGTLREILSIGIDITDRKRAEEEVKARENQYRGIFNSVTDGLLIFDFEGRVVEANPAACRMYGYGTDELCGLHGYSFIQTENRKEFERFSALLQEGKRFYTEVREFRRDGTPFWIEVSGARLLFKGEQHMLAVLRDVTDRKEAEAALRESEHKYREVVDHANEGIVVAQGPYLRFINPKMCDLLGYEEAEFFGRPFLEFIHEDDRDVARFRYERRLKGEEPPDVHEYRILHKDGSMRWMQTSAVAIEWEGQKAALYFLSDVTERRRAEQALQDANDELQQAYEELRAAQVQLIQTEKMASLGNLVAGVAHEINTPMGAIRSIHDTQVRAFNKLKAALAATNDRDLQHNLRSILEMIDEANRVIENAGGRVSDIIKRLKSFARLDEAELKRCNVHDGLEDALALVHHQIKHTITVHREFGDLPEITCYPGQLNQVFLNLLVNAGQAIHGTGEIKIRTWHDASNIYIAISDTGEGISEEQLPRIFDPGYTTKGVGVGTGLGLSICYQIVRNHYGEILVDSRRGEGSTFTVKLPIHHPHDHT